MNKDYLIKEIDRTMRKGFFYAYHYREGGTLSGALTFRMVSTSPKAAKSAAERLLYQGKRVVKVWDLQEELLTLKKNNHG